MIDLKFSKINIESITKDELKKEIEKLEKIKNQYENKDKALKKLLVSSYGVIGNPRFLMYDPKIAETITSQGQHMIKFIAYAINLYFKEKWYNDTKIHNLMNINVTSNINENVVIYIVTDSCFVCFDNIIKTTNWDKNSIEFIKLFYELRFKKYLNKVFNVYANKFNTDNLQFMKMESISKSGLWLGKNKYILDVVWERGDITYKSLTNIIAKGGELVQKDTPPFIREKMKKAVKYIFENGKYLNINNFIILIKQIKQEYKLQDIQNISYCANLNNYETYVLDDRNNIEITNMCPTHIKAAAIYNYKLNQNLNFKLKYSLLKSGDRIKYYYVKSKFKENNLFAFNIGKFPIEFAPEFDYDLMFNKSFIDPLNKILKVINIPLINENLVTVDKWF